MMIKNWIYASHITTYKDVHNGKVAVYSTLFTLSYLQVSVNLQTIFSIKWSNVYLLFQQRTMTIF